MLGRTGDLLDSRDTMSHIKLSVVPIRSRVAARTSIVLSFAPLRVVMITLSVRMPMLHRD